MTTGFLIVIGICHLQKSRVAMVNQGTQAYMRDCGCLPMPLYPGGMALKYCTSMPNGMAISTIAAKSRQGAPSICRSLN
jgi:hypothetical protein